jgi:hypothetical protein
MGVLTPGANPTTYKFTITMPALYRNRPERFLNIEENIFVFKTH